jgi:hypothetical protein
MATLRNRHGKWQARVQRKGQQPVSQSFQSKEDPAMGKAVCGHHGGLSHDPISKEGKERI